MCNAQLLLLCLTFIFGLVIGPDYHSSVMMIPYLHCFESAGKASRTLSWWCFNPGIAMQEFSRLEVGSIILTSGTLSPMDSFAQELKL